LHIRLDIYRDLGDTPPVIFAWAHIREMKGRLENVE
jgi:hypothetical protein